MNSPAAANSLPTRTCGRHRRPSSCSAVVYRMRARRRHGPTTTTTTTTIGTRRTYRFLCAARRPNVVHLSRGNTSPFRWFSACFRLLTDRFLLTTIDDRDQTSPALVGMGQVAVLEVEMEVAPLDLPVAARRAMTVDGHSREMRRLLATVAPTDPNPTATTATRRMEACAPLVARMKRQSRRLLVVLRAPGRARRSTRTSRARKAWWISSSSR